MSIMMTNYIDSNYLRPAVPSWVRLERCEYCEPFNKNAGSAKRSILSSRSDKKRNRK